MSMMESTTYGVISDIHHNPHIITPAIETLKDLGSEKLLINGDIGERQKELQDSQDYVAIILQAVGKSNLESYVQPGSHESIGAYDPVIRHFSEKYSNIINTLEIPKAENKNHDLVFLPGSDWVSKGEYMITNHKDLGTETYIKTKEGLFQSNYETYFGFLSGQIEMPEELHGKINGIIHYTNMNDLRKLVTDPEKTIVVCHVPMKFDNVDEAVDMAHFHQGRVYHRDVNDMSKWTYTEMGLKWVYFLELLRKKTLLNQTEQGLLVWMILMNIS